MESAAPVSLSRAQEFMEKVDKSIDALANTVRRLCEQTELVCACRTTGEVTRPLEEMQGSKLVLWMAETEAQINALTGKLATVLSEMEI